MLDERETRATSHSNRCEALHASVGLEFVDRTLGTSSMRALGIRSSYKGRTVDASAMRGDEGRGQLR
jgi:hypothetical protein